MYYDHPLIFGLGWRSFGANFMGLKRAAATAAGAACMLVHIGIADLLTRMLVFGKAEFVDLSACSEGTGIKEL
ncbi:hypothetical protein L6164_007849 [Bauhinia variegata]|uniref:Uncharacterized protein n=1 Tax=Bauhinia variegata TaxID=167791 RepID=A0ACB9PDS0_BAUVA|nr:hypothetical protein L6164_007849 [Bauhinia variegata]